jgi:type VI secretion system protein ImpG
MRDELLKYYERELAYLRRMAGGFAEQYPKVAGRLLLEPGKSEDPHVERLIEAFAFLAARVHLKLDDEFPEITESLLQILYPHYLRPVPSMSVVQFKLDPEQGKLSTGYPIARHRRLLARQSQDTSCRFRTCYPVTLWPIDLDSARIEQPPHAASSGKTYPAAIALRLKTLSPDTRLSDLRIDSLRFFLNGESQFVHRLYETIFGHCVSVEVHNGTARIALSRGALSEVGFGPDEGMLPYSSRSFPGYRLLQEYFHFPEKFLFFDIKDLPVLSTGGFGADATLMLYLDQAPQLEQNIEAQHFRLGCTPVVNLFQQTAEPIRLDQAHTEYRVIADVHRRHTTEVYSVDAVKSLSPATGEAVEYQPIYSFKHSFERRQQRTFWHTSRRLSEHKDDAGTEMFLTLVDLDFRPSRPATDVVMASITCTNRDLPGLLPFGDPEGDFVLEGAAPIRRVTCLTKPTRTLRPPLGHRVQWRLISHLSLNFVSAVEGGLDNDPEALQEILRLYDFSESAAVQQQIVGIAGVSSRQVWRRIRAAVGSGFARGIEATLEFDESKYVGAGVYLFSAVLERFLGLYVSINSFSEMITVSRQRGVVKRWPPRAGQQALL